MICCSFIDIIKFDGRFLQFGPTPATAAIPATLTYFPHTHTHTHTPIKREGQVFAHFYDFLIDNWPPTKAVSDGKSEMEVNLL